MGKLKVGEVKELSQDLGFEYRQLDLESRAFIFNHYTILYYFYYVTTIFKIFAVVK